MTGAGDRIDGDAVIGADGLRSTVRRSLWPDATVRPAGVLAARLIGRVADPGGARAGEYGDRGDYAGVAPLATAGCTATWWCRSPRPRRPNRDQPWSGGGDRLVGLLPGSMLLRGFDSAMRWRPSGQ